MDTEDAGRILEAEVVLGCSDLDETTSFFTDELGFRLHAVFPADDPSTAVVTGHGLRLRLQRDSDGGPGLLRLLCRDPSLLAGGRTELLAPNGTRVLLEDVDSGSELPPLAPSLVLTRKDDVAAWARGRAGMRYRDLVPDRQGGRFIASHIEIPDGGPVPDYVHYHRVRFQMIYCYRGWVRVVYEDQGPPFVLQAGDCVLQPPGIRHRVLESSAGLEVIEIASPAAHETLVDHELSLPTPELRPEREFGGQRFVRHEASGASWVPWRLAGFEARDLGFEGPTGGLAQAQVVRPSGSPSSPPCSHDAELVFLFVLEGSAALRCEGRDVMEVSEGDTVVVPRGIRHALADCSADAELLHVGLPAAFETRLHPKTSLS